MKMKLGIRIQTVKYTALLILPLVLATLGRAEPILRPSDSSLDSLIARAWNNHPDLASMHQMIEAESARGTMARAWMNPTLTLGLMDLPQSFDIHQDASTAFTIGVMQRFSFPGKRRIASDGSEARVEATKLDFASSRQEMAAMVAMAYYDLAALIEADSLLLVGQSLNDEMIAAAGWMNASGMGRQSDLERARLEKENWRLKVIANRGEIERKRADLAYAIGSAFDSTDQTALMLPPDLPSLPNIDSALASGAIDRAPLVLVAGARVKSAKAGVRRAQRDWYPDFDLSVTYGVKPDLRVTAYDPTGMLMTERMKMDNMISVELSAPIPLFSKGNQQAQLAEMAAMDSKASADLTRVKLELERRLRKIHGSWREQNDCCSFVRDNVIGKAESLYKSVLIDYQSGKTPYDALSQAKMTLVMANLELAMSRAEAWGYKAEWDAALGLIGNNQEGENGTR